MKLNEYQTLARRTIPNDRYFDKLANYGMGLSGEAGEVTDELKKFLFHGHDLDVQNIASELGDVLHYVAGIATMLDIDLSDVARGNIDKSKGRYPNGFTQNDSKNRRN